jgi:hypothetical protein
MRRKRFQFHLSTAVVLMLTAEGWILANLHDRFIENLNVIHTGKMKCKYEQHAAGWPFPVRKRVYRVMVTSEGRVVQSSVMSETWAYYAIPLDAIATIILLLPIWFLCEWLVRRRAARKAP